MTHKDDKPQEMPQYDPRNYEEDSDDMEVERIRYSLMKAIY